MKRCTQCDFIYEDDQTLCDMDGKELVSIPMALQQGNLESQTVRPTKPSPRRFALQIVGAVLLGFVLMVGYYGFVPQATPQTPGHSQEKPVPSQQSPPNASEHSSPEITIGNLSVPQTSLDASPEGVTDPPPATKASPEQRGAKSNPTPNLSRGTHTAPPIVKPVSARFVSQKPPRNEKKFEPEKSIRKKDSKIGSFLKKTTRILKKPFKF